MINKLLSLDIGTTSVKAGIFSEDGVMLASALDEYQLITPSVNQAELPVEKYWESSVKTIRQVITKSGVDTKEIAGISVSSQGETLIVLDKQGVPLRNAIVWIDNRAESQAAFLKEKLGNPYDITGIPDIVPTWPACKIMWIRENEPEVFQKAGKFILVQDYILFRLTGKYVTNGSISCTTLYFDITKNEWWNKALNAIQLLSDQLPEITVVGAVIGDTTKEANAILGLKDGIPVIGGGMDQSACAIGAGTISEGVVSETTGSALCIQMVADRPDKDKRKLVPVYAHSIQGKYLFVPVCPTAGMAFKWFKDNFACEETSIARKQGTDVYDMLTDLAAKIPAGSDGLIMLPHLMGAFSPYSNPDAKGSFTGFSVHHTKGHFVRAILESVAFLLRQNLEVIADAGSSFSEIRATGGGAKSALWNQIKADVCNLPVVTLENEETGLIGNAILVGTATGIFADTEAGCEKFVKIKSKVMPSNNKDLYEKPYTDYCLLDRKLGDYFKEGK